MKVSSVTFYKSSNIRNIGNTPQKKREHVSFGFGEDYGSDLSENAFPNASHPSTLNSLKYLAQLAVAAGSELLGSDKERLRQIERLGWQYEEREKREEEERRKNMPKQEEDDWDF